MNDRYLYKQDHRILAIVKPEGKATLHAEQGYQVQAPLDFMTQEATVMLLKEQGFEDVTGSLIQWK